MELVPLDQSLEVTGPNEIAAPEPTEADLLAAMHFMKHALATVNTVDEAKRARGFVDVLADLADAADARQELLVEVAAHRVRAERRLGQVLLELNLAKDSSGNQYTGKLDRSHDESGPITLKEWGITVSRSCRAQLLAKIPDDEFETWLHEQRTASKTPTLKAAQKFAKAFLEPSEPGGEGARDDPPQDEPLPQIPDGPEAILEELLEHHQVMDKMLAQVFRGGTVEMPEKSAHHLERLMAATLQLLKELHYWHTQVK